MRSFPPSPRREKCTLVFDSFAAKGNLSHLALNERQGGYESTAMEFFAINGKQLIVLVSVRSLIPIRGLN